MSLKKKINLLGSNVVIKDLTKKNEIWIDFEFMKAVYYIASIEFLLILVLLVTVVSFLFFFMLLKVYLKSGEGENRG
ncbi:hypothetical protein [Cytobacillus purgationiresistens]|uniref:hypothetical protein n=1 Tax=Cytobacillus purgationiresistens TaxID=863449 RepID=UPI0027D784DB|nr:hypothetical protein [Cytobacillus purgationiresistens]